MTQDQADPAHIERPGPADFRSPVVRLEIRKAAVWFGMALLVAGLIVLAQPLLLIIGGMVLAVMLDGGARLLGRVLPLGRGLRLAIVIVAVFGFLAWTFYYAGTTFAREAEALRTVVTAQFERVAGLAANLGLVPEGGAAQIGQQLLGSIGKLTSAVGSAIGAFTSMILILVIGIFIAIEPRLYDRGVAWMLPLRHRHRFYEVGDAVGFTLRRLLAGRLLGMVIEGIFTWVMLAYVGQLFGIGAVPMAALLGLLTGLLAFLPNIGAIVSGVLMVAVGFSAGVEQGLWAVFVYFAVQNFDGYVILPYIAKKTVDLAPAVVLAAQLLFGALFGLLGILLADPILAAIKTALIETSRTRPGGKTAASAAAAAEAPRPAEPVRQARPRSGPPPRPRRRS